jgi:hypothetical protein
MCVELMQQKLTITEAERNVGEFIMSPPVEDDLNHYVELADAMDEMDLDKLGRILEEGVKRNG